MAAGSGESPLTLEVCPEFHVFLARVRRGGVASVSLSRTVTMSVAIVGGGACGIAALKALREAHIDATLFEEADMVGGVWVLDRESKRVRMRRRVAF